MARIGERIDTSHMWPNPPKLIIAVATATGTNARKPTAATRRRTDEQNAARELIAFLGASWNTMTPAEKLVWGGNLGYASYAAMMTKRWHHLPGGTSILTPTATTNTSATTPARACTLAEHTTRHSAITILFQLETNANHWGFLLCRSQQTIVTPTRQMTIALQNQRPQHDICLVDAGLKPGNYHYRASQFNADGTIGPFSDDVQISIP